MLESLGVELDVQVRRRSYKVGEVFVGFDVEIGSQQQQSIPASVRFPKRARNRANGILFTDNGLFSDSPMSKAKDELKKK